MAKGDGSGGMILEGNTVDEVLRNGGQVSAVEALRCRVRYFTDGVILGRQ